MTPDQRFLTSGRIAMTGWLLLFLVLAAFRRDAGSARQGVRHGSTPRRRAWQMTAGRWVLADRA